MDINGFRRFLEGMVEDYGEYTKYMIPRAVNNPVISGFSIGFRHYFMIDPNYMNIDIVFPLSPLSKRLSAVYEICEFDYLNQLLLVAHAFLTRWIFCFTVVVVMSRPK